MDDNVSQVNVTAIQASVPERETYESILSVMFLLVTMVTALVGNTAVIAVVTKQRSMRVEVSNLLIVNLSITDLSNMLLVMMSALVSLLMDRWPFGEFWCAVTCAINYCLIIVSMLTLSCISLDRHQAVMNPLSYPLRVTRKRMKAVILFTWVQGIIFGITPSLLNWVEYDYWEAICAIQWHLFRPSSIIYVVFAFVCCFLGPGIVLIYCYAIILSEVKKQRSQIMGNKCGDAGTLEKNRKKVSDRAKITWSLLTVVLAYFVCTTPFSVTKLIKVSVTDARVVPGQLNLTASLLGYVASAINPLIYGIFRRDFRKAYINLLKSLFSCREMSQLTNTSKGGQSQVTNCVTNGDQQTINQTSVCNSNQQLNINNQLTELTLANSHQNGGVSKQKMTVSIKDQYKSQETVLEAFDDTCDTYHGIKHQNYAESPVSCTQVTVKERADSCEVIAVKETNMCCTQVMVKSATEDIQQSNDIIS